MTSTAMVIETANTTAFVITTASHLLQLIVMAISTATAMTIRAATAMGAVTAVVTVTLTALSYEDPYRAQAPVVLS